MSGEGFALKEEPTRHCWGAMHPIASLRVASSSFAVMKMTGHFDPDAASRRRSSVPKSPEVDVEQQAGCRLHAVAIEQSLGRGERPAVDTVVRQQPCHAMPALSSTTITTVGGAISVSSTEARIYGLRGSANP
jgi:hypothetical protein